MVSRASAAQQSRDTRKTNKAKQPPLFPIEIIAKLEWTQSNAQQNRTITESHNGSNNQQRNTNNRTTALEWKANLPYHKSLKSISCGFVVSRLLCSLVCDIFFFFVPFPYSVLGQVWYLILSAPALCLLPYIKLKPDSF